LYLPPELGLFPDFTKDLLGNILYKGMYLPKQIISIWRVRGFTARDDFHDFTIITLVVTISMYRYNASKRFGERLKLAESTGNMLLLMADQHYAFVFIR